MAAAVRTYYYQQGGERSPSQTKSWPTSCVTALTASSRRRPGHSHRSSKCQDTSLTRGPWLHFVALCSRAGGQHPTDVTAAAVTAVAAQLPEPLRTLSAPCLLVVLQRRWQCFSPVSCTYRLRLTDRSSTAAVRAVDRWLVQTPKASSSW